MRIPPHHNNITVGFWVSTIPHLHLPLHWNVLLIRDREELPSAGERVMQSIRQFVSIVELSLLLSATVASAQIKQTSQGEKRKMSNETNFQLLIPNTMPKSVGYSQLAVVTGGTVVFI